MTKERKKEVIKEGMMLIGWTAAGTLLTLLAGTAWLIWRTKLALFWLAVQGVLLIAIIIIFWLWLWSIKKEAKQGSEYDVND